MVVRIFGCGEGGEELIVVCIGKSSYAQGTVIH